MTTIKIREIGDVKMCRRILKNQTTTNPADVPFFIRFPHSAVPLRTIFYGTHIVNIETSIHFLKLAPF